MVGSSGVAATFEVRPEARRVIRSRLSLWVIVGGGLAALSIRMLGNPSSVIWFLGLLTITGYVILLAAGLRLGDDARRAARRLRSDGTAGRIAYGYIYPDLRMVALDVAFAELTAWRADRGEPVEVGSVKGIEHVAISAARWRSSRFYVYVLEASSADNRIEVTLGAKATLGGTFATKRAYMRAAAQLLGTSPQELRAVGYRGGESQ